MRGLLVGSFLVAGLFWTSFAYGAGGDAILGLWSTLDHDAQFMLYKCGTQYCGDISSLREPNYSAENKEGLAGLPKRDIHNPDARLRKRTLVGLPLLRGFHYAGHNLWEGGQIYDPDDGKEYSAMIWLDGKKHLKLRGYWGFSLFGRTETWVR